MKSVLLLNLILSHLLGFGTVVQANVTQPKKTLNVGIILRLKDKFNDTLSSTLEGIETARTLFEKTHPEFQVHFKRYSHDESLESVLDASKRAIHDHIPAVVGGELSEESFVIRDQLGPRKIVFVTPTSSNPAVTEGYPFAFRVCLSDRWVASELARFTVQHLKPRAIGMIHDLSSPYTDFQSRQFLATFEQLMSQLPQDQRIPIIVEKTVKDTVNFDIPIKTFIQNEVTHVVLLVHQGEFFRFVPQAGSASFFPTYVGSDGWGSDERINRELFDGSQWKSKFVGYRPSLWNEGTTTSIGKLFLAEHTRLNSAHPNAWSAVGFDAMWVLLQAMSRAGDPTNGEEIRQQLKAIHGMELVTHPTFTFGPDNSPRSSLPIYRLQPNRTSLEVTLK